MIHEPNPHPNRSGIAPMRLFLRDPAWSVGQKVGSEREFCYMMTPGDDYYHRLYDGEIFLYHGDERLCLACADRRGLLAHAPKSLRDPTGIFDQDRQPELDSEPYPPQPPPPESDAGPDQF